MRCHAHNTVVQKISTLWSAFLFGLASITLLASCGGSEKTVQESVSIGRASVIGESSDKTMYQQAYSVIVTDADNKPVANRVVSLKIRPIAFSTGSSCVIDYTYCSEDTNGNGILDEGEDGKRIRLPDDAMASVTESCPQVSGATTYEGLKNGVLTPANSDSGTVPITITTDANGQATFKHSYLKAHAYWLINRLTATINSNGSESSKSLVFRSIALDSDVDPKCYIPPSPFTD